MEHPPLKVLVVEDNEDAAQSLMQMLELNGYDVALAKTGPEGVDIAQGFNPDVILCDIGLPGFDGYEVARRLRHSDICSGVLLVAVTGYGQESDRKNAFDAGYNVHVTKPADPRTLVRILEAAPSWLEAKRTETHTVGH
jgi:CheY-like chemotaxis protein